MKLLLLLGAGILASLNLYAQGTVDFKNDSATRVTNSLTGQPALAGGAFRAALYWAPLSNPNNFQPLGAAATIGVPLTGYFVGGNRTTGVETGGGENARFMVRCWESSYGATYEAALASPAINGRKALTGQSGIVVLITGSPPIGTPGSLLAPEANPALTGITLVTETPVIRSITSSGGSATLTWAAIPGRNYVVEYKTALGNPAIQWTPLIGDVIASGFSASKTDNTLGNAPQRFYRVYLSP